MGKRVGKMGFSRQETRVKRTANVPWVVSHIRFFSFVRVCVSAECETHKIHLFKEQTILAYEKRLPNTLSRLPSSYLVAITCYCSTYIPEYLKYVVLGTLWTWHFNWNRSCGPVI